MDYLLSGPKIFKIKIVPLSLGITLIGSGLAMIYYMIKVDDECDRDLLDQPNKRRRTFTELLIEKDRVGYLIGKGGVKIKEIQEKSATRITFKDEVATDEHRVCVIRGLPSHVQKAEYMVRDFLAANKIETIEFIIPQNTCGLIIGKGGATIRMLQKESGAKILVDSSDVEVKGQKVTIKGTSAEVSKAKEMIKSKIEEQFSWSEKDTNPQVNGYSNGDVPRNTRPSSSELFESFESSNVEMLDSGIDQIQVFVSSLKNPSSFYIQIADERQDWLNKLEEDMLSFYEDEENKKLHKLESAGVGRLVATKYKDGKWYRGTVVKTKSTADIVKVFYVDYGDVEWRNLEETFALNPKFQDLKHQAILCSLDGIKKSERHWSEEAVDFFQEMTYDAEKGKKLIAKVEGLCGTPNNIYIPSVSLKTSDEPEGKLVAQEMISNGFGTAVTPTLPRLVPGGDEDWS